MIWKISFEIFQIRFIEIFKEIKYLKNIAKFITLDMSNDELEFQIEELADKFPDVQFNNLIVLESINFDGNIFYLEKQTRKYYHYNKHQKLWYETDGFVKDNLIKRLKDSHNKSGTFHPKQKDINRPDFLLFDRSFPNVDPKLLVEIPYRFRDGTIHYTHQGNENVYSYDYTGIPKWNIQNEKQAKAIKRFIQNSMKQTQ